MLRPLFPITIAVFSVSAALPALAQEQAPIDWSEIYPDMTTLEDRFPVGTSRIDLLRFLHVYGFTIAQAGPFSPSPPSTAISIPTTGHGHWVTVTAGEIHLAYPYCRDEACAFILANGRQPDVVTLGLTGSPVLYGWVVVDGEVREALNLSSPRNARSD